jgi:acyl-CoA synthetase (AMP-forming)/AMP-acid ligase II
MSSLVHYRPVTDPTFTGPALADPRRRIDHATFRHQVRGTADLMAAHGIGAGDVVAAVLPNRVELVTTMYAAWSLGAAFTPVNPALTEDEITYQLRDSGARLAVVDGEAAIRVCDVTTLDVDTLAPDRALTATPATPGQCPRPEGLALLIYTSGTTGRPKGVALDHANLAAMTTALHQHFRFGAADRALLVLPLFHVNAIMLSVVAPLSAGGSAMILPRFDRKSFWDTVRAENPSYFSAVPAIFMLLSDLPLDQRPGETSVRFAVCGAAPMPATAITAFENAYGIPIVEGYGLSESTVALTLNPLDGPRKAGTVGRPLPGIEVRIVDGRGRPVADGVDGEVVARGATVMRGYLGKPAETAAALVEGWLHTGDIGHLDADGYLRLVDRKKELIIRGGENIAPSEVEAVLLSHPGVLEAAVVGRSVPVMGEEPVAFVVPRAGHTLDAEGLLDHAGRVLAGYKVPREVFMLQALPRNAVGKVVKAPLRDRFAAVSSGS